MTRSLARRRLTDELTGPALYMRSVLQNRPYRGGSQSEVVEAGGKHPRWQNIGITTPPSVGGSYLRNNLPPVPCEFALSTCKTQRSRSVNDLSTIGNHNTLQCMTNLRHSHTRQPWGYVPISSHSYCSSHGHPRLAGTAAPANIVEQDIWHNQYILTPS